MIDNRNGRVGLVGHYQHQNYGDDLLAVLFHRALSRLDVKETIVFDCDEAIQQAIKMPDVYTWKSHYKSCDCVVFGGGGILGELVPGRFSWSIFLDYFKKARNLRSAGIPYAMVAVGAGPVRTRIGRLLIRYIVGGAEFVIARDQSSFAFLQEFMREDRLILGTDYAFSLCAEDTAGTVDDVDVLLQDLPEPRLGVNMMMLSGHDRPPVEHDLAAVIRDELLAAYQAGKFQSLVLLLNASDSTEMINSVALLDRLPVRHYIVFVHRNVWETTRLISRLDFLFTMKLHFGIAAYMLNTPVFCIGYHPKAERFFEQIGKLRYYESSERYHREMLLFERFFNEYLHFFDARLGRRDRECERIEEMDRKLSEFVLDCVSRSLKT
jgi:polysaccharide pyruvyl transferase WcaK-like protein